MYSKAMDMAESQKTIQRRDAGLRESYRKARREVDFGRDSMERLK